MDTFITVIFWVAGFYAAFILLLAMVFSAGGHAQTGDSGLGIMSLVSTFLFLFLIYLGASSLFSTDDAKVSSKIQSEKSISIEHTEANNVIETEKIEKAQTVVNTQNDNIILWILYIFMFFPVPFIVYLFYKKVKGKK